MPDKPTFVVNDRRKFTSEGDLRHDSPIGETSSATSSDSTETEERKGPQLVSTSAAGSSEASTLTDVPESEAKAAAPESAPLGQSDEPEAVASFSDDQFPPGPTAEETEEAARAYDATVDRLDTAMRAADPGGERMPPMSFERLTQSLYTQALLLLGGATQPGENPRVDIIGARQTIDMLAVLAEKTRGNLTEDEDRLLQSALFDLRMGFLEITQALARQAAQRQPGASGAPTAGAGPRIVR